MVHSLNYRVQDPVFESWGEGVDKVVELRCGVLPVGFFLKLCSF